MLQRDRGLGVSASMLPSVIWLGVHLSMSILEAEVCLASGTWLGPQTVVCHRLQTFFCGWGVTYGDSPPSTVLKRYFFLTMRLVHIYIIIKIPNKHKI